MFNMNSIEYLFVQYVMCVVNEGDKDTCMTLTHDGAMDLINMAGVVVTEHDDTGVCGLMEDEDEDS